MTSQERCSELAFSLVMWFLAPPCGQIQNMLPISPKKGDYHLICFQYHLKGVSGRQKNGKAGGA